MKKFRDINYSVLEHYYHCLYIAKDDLFHTKTYEEECRKLEQINRLETIIMECYVPSK